MKEGFNAFAVHIRQDTKFFDTLERPQKTPNNPYFYYAPALILRKRNTQGLYNTYEQIVQQLEDTNSYVLEIKVEKAKDKLHALRREKSLTQDQILAVQEKNFRLLTINEKYEGTLSQLSEMVAENKATYQWFPDKISDAEKAQFVPQIKEYFQQQKKYDEQDVSTLKLELPLKENLPEESLLIQYNTVKEELQKRPLNPGIDFNRKDIDMGEVSELISKIQQIRDHLQIDFPRETVILEDLYSGDKNIWEQKNRSF